MPLRTRLRHTSRRRLIWLGKGYNVAESSGMIDKYGGSRAQGIREGAKTAMDTYDRFERMAGDADRVVKGMR